MRGVMGSVGVSGWSLDSAWSSSGSVRSVGSVTGFQSSDLLSELSRGSDEPSVLFH